MWTGDDRIFFFNPTIHLSVWERPGELIGRDITHIIQDPPHKRKRTTPAGWSSHLSVNSSVRHFTCLSSHLSLTSHVCHFTCLLSPPVCYLTCLHLRTLSSHFSFNSPVYHLTCLWLHLCVTSPFCQLMSVISPVCYLTCLWLHLFVISPFCQLTCLSPHVSHLTCLLSHLCVTSPLSHLTFLSTHVLVITSVFDFTCLSLHLSVISPVCQSRTVIITIIIIIELNGLMKSISFQQTVAPSFNHLVPMVLMNMNKTLKGTGESKQAKQNREDSVRFLFVLVVDSKLQISSPLNDEIGYTLSSRFSQSFHKITIPVCLTVSLSL